MNDLAEILLKGGKGNANATIKGTFYRQFLPASHVRCYLLYKSILSNMHKSCMVLGRI